MNCTKCLSVRRDQDELLGEYCWICMDLMCRDCWELHGHCSEIECVKIGDRERNRFK